MQGLFARILMATGFRSFMLGRTACAVLALGIQAACGFVAFANPPQLLPIPKSLQLTDGQMPLTVTSRIIVQDPSLQPLAGILAEEIEVLTGLKLSANNLAQPPADGDIVLRINPAIRADEDILALKKEGGKPAVARCKDFAHTIVIAKTAIVEGWDYRAACEGTATLLQALDSKDGAWFFPCLTIKDWPSCDYTGTMVDVARQRIPIDVLQAVVEACRLWKIRYCQLHLSDNEAFTFPSTAFPKLGSKNVALHDGVVPVVYKLQELQDLVAYADARGVTLVPELAMPNHSEAMCRSMPELFAGPKVLNIINDGMYQSLDTLIGEVCDLFKSSPYFHMGCEDLYFYELEEQQACKDYLQKHGLKSVEDVFVQHVKRTNESIRKRGKMTLAWEGVAVPSEGRPRVLPEELRSEIIPMCWFPWPTSEELQKQGYTTITVPWDRGDALKKWNIYLCNGCKLDAASSKVLGGAVTMWQMSAAAVVSNFLGGNLNGSNTEGYIQSLGDHMQGTWSPLAVVDAEAHDKGLAASRAKLLSLLFPVRITASAIAYPGWPVIGNQFFSGDVLVSLSAGNPPAAVAKDSGEIRYTLDGSEPSLQSTVYSSPLEIDATTTVQAALFKNGRQVGAVARAQFARLDNDGSLAKWQIAGPYSVAGKKANELFDERFEPEVSGDAEWKPFSGGSVKFAEVAGFAGNDRVAYMKTQIYSPKAQAAKLLVGSDDGAKIFLNGKVVHEANVVRPAFQGEVIDVSLKEGWNKLQIKVTNGDGGWEAWAKLQNAAGGRLEGQRVKAE